ncbi:glutamate-5-semialdehyde dehydrogenase [Caldanaerobius fijiensis DSM 17918]|uniref:Gamma-glutamyl phosphate reductase n=1 Tax=Caldanaerobius fijiensis DSM 17918 TaxID=1121256 RepID=A0A1M4U5K4_9THEO|nr:glutamate-5-semialdehyde dehydrogenase [Caldanaerobius fijiensis]SHE51926.1 glutamate-5-semialdehyde dehydrogenase [Caldanaerobius fijiensis DSM 17918]
MLDELVQKCAQAKDSSRKMGMLSSDQKNEILLKMAESLMDNEERILEANFYDVEREKKKGLSNALIDRLTLNHRRIQDMVDGLKELTTLSDPVGEIEGMWKRPNGLTIGKIRVPIGVIGIIYEARPNVTVDAAGLCIKAGNSVVLKGGSEAIESNKTIVDIISKAAYRAGAPMGCIQLIEDTDRETVKRLMRMNEYLDVLIPRGGAGLIKAVVQNATVPVIETGVGNCHTYVDDEADLKKAEEIAFNAKVQRPGVCNAMETLLVNEKIAQVFLPPMIERFKKAGVEIRGCEKTRAICPEVVPATEEDWATEYLDLILAVKVVRDIDEAIEHIYKYGTKHSEAIVTENYSKAKKFLREVDAAAVYVNASTRFTDGGQYGFGAEIGISTQKLHARGPMGLKELTTYKYIVLGDGQIRT